MDERRPLRAATARHLAYCTNVHAGESLEQTLANLETYAVDVRRRLARPGPLGVGLWLSARAARQARRRDPAELAAWLAQRDLEVRTVNGFPYGDFHRPVVKHDVYEPSWCDDRRLEYTLDLAEILAALVPEGDEGSISTLPVGWAASISDADCARAGALLRRAVDGLARLEDATGRLIHLDLEPEPGCRLQRSGDVVELVARHVPDAGAPERVRRHLRVCHDVCHAAVMFEPQAEMLDRYAAAGLSVGKVQISSALHVPFDGLEPGQRTAALRELEAFREPRYLHQATEPVDGGLRLHEDLPEAIAAWSAGGPPGSPCRVHFHVPVFAERLGLLRTTQPEIDACLDLIEARDEIRHVEVETYAWDVLPPALAAASLADGIARELRWVRERRPGLFA